MTFELCCTANVADLGPGAFLTPGSGMEKSRTLDPVSEINVPDNISNSLVAITWVKNA
jgi:hypothetical protein